VELVAELSGPADQALTRGDGGAALWGRGPPMNSVVPTEAGLVADRRLPLIAGMSRATSPWSRRLPSCCCRLGGLLAVSRYGAPRRPPTSGSRASLPWRTSILPVAWVCPPPTRPSCRPGATPPGSRCSAPLLAGYAHPVVDPHARLVHPTARPPLFAVRPYVAYAWLLLIVGAAGFIATARRLRGITTRVISLGVCVPVLANLVFLAGGGAAIDPTAILVGVSVLVVRLFVFDAGLAAFLPVARRDVIDHLESGVLVADLHGVVVDANTAAKQLTGGATLVGRPLGEVTREATRDPTRTIEVRTTPVLGRPGVVGAFALLIDRTESQRLEQPSSPRSSRRSEPTAGTPTGTTCCSRARQPGALQDLDDAVRDPDLRPSLPPKLDALLEEAPELIADSIEGVERIGRLVQRLRRFAHAGGEEPELVPVDLSTVAARARALAGVGLADDAIRCLGGGAPLVLASEDELVQIAVNLLVNALQASDGRPEL
jgi:signal transduction histidine kinase